MSKARERKKGEEQGTLWLAATLDVLRGGAFAAAAALVVLAAAAGLISAGGLSDGLTDSAVIAACLVGAFAGGMLVVLRRSAMPLVTGVGVGVVLFLLLLTAGVLLYDSTPAAQGAGSVFCACLCGGGLAGILGSRPKKKRRK